MPSSLTSHVSQGGWLTSYAEVNAGPGVQSVVKSHLDAIPEDRKAVDKGGGNAVQKLHDVEKYLRKNKLKVISSQVL